VTGKRKAASRRQENGADAKMMNTAKDGAEAPSF